MIRMDNVTVEITLLIVGIIVALAAIIVTIRLNKKNEKKVIELHVDQQRSDRIDAVVNEYAQVLRQGKSVDIPGLIRSNISTLKTEDEAREAVTKISNLQAQRNPLSSYQEKIEHVGVLIFFRNITLEQYKANQIDDVIRKLNK